MGNNNNDKDENEWNDIHEINHISADMKSSEAMILTVLNAILAIT